MELDDTLRALLTALGIGLMIGIVRERMHGGPQTLAAGTRTHALICLLGCIGWMLGSAAFVVCLLLVGALTIAAYLHTARDDPGLTGEVALLLSVVLGGLSVDHASLAAALGVLVAILLLLKAPMQKLSRELISERELQDGLMLGAAALVVMPLLPSEPLDPWGTVSPVTVWRIVVLVMAVGMFGHIAQRLFGARWGLPIAGFFSGFVSSSAAVTGMGQSARENSEQTTACASAALLANLASLLLFLAVVGTISPVLLRAALPSLGAAVLALLLVSACLQWLAHRSDLVVAQSSGRAFKLSQALLIAALIAGYRCWPHGWGALWQRRRAGHHHAGGTGRGACSGRRCGAVAAVWHRAARCGLLGHSGRAQRQQPGQDRAGLCQRRHALRLAGCRRSGCHALRCVAGFAAIELRKNLRP